MAELVDEVAEQLRQEGTRAAEAAAGLAGPDAAERWAREISNHCAAIADVLVHADGEDLAEQTRKVMRALWPNAAPEQAGRADWWMTPLGRCCARSLAHDPNETGLVSHETAAAILGVDRSTVGALVARGKLERQTPPPKTRASVRRGSVFHYLISRRPRGARGPTGGGDA